MSVPAVLGLVCLGLLALLLATVAVPRWRAATRTIDALVAQPEPDPIDQHADNLDNPWKPERY